MNRFRSILAALICTLGITSIGITSISRAADTLRAPFRMFDVWTHGNVVAGDFNEDGAIDAAVANGSGNAVALLFGSGQGSFATPCSYFPVGSNPVDIAAADLDGDGHLDLVTANGNGLSLSILKGRGNGTFDPAVTVTLPAKPLYLALGDLTGDGRPDLVIDCDKLLAICVNQGNGSFGAPWTVATRGNRRLAVGDVTADGRADVLVVRTLSDSLWVYPGTGAGTLGAPTGYKTGHFPRTPLISDINRDGRPDMVVIGGSTTAVHLAKSTGGFQAPVLLNTDGAETGVVADLNGDLKPDLALAIASYPTAASGGTAGYLGIALGNGTGSFSAVSSTLCGEGASGVALADFDGDGLRDALLVNGAWEGVSFLHGYGNGTFGGGLHLAAPWNTQLVSAADLNGDGKLDLVALCSSECNSYSPHYGAIATWLGAGDGTFGSPSVISIYSNAFCVAGMVLADFNEDGRPDLVYGNASEPVVHLMPGYANGTFASSITITIGREIAGLAAADFDGDGHLDLVLADYGVTGAQIRILKGAGDGTFTPGATYPYAGLGLAIAVGRINGDTVPDLVVLSQGDNSATVLIGNGAGTFSQAASLALLSAPAGVSLADMNLDGRTDLVIGYQGSPAISVYPGVGDGTFGAPVTVPTAATNGPVAAVDLNRDGAPDLVSASIGVAVYTGNNGLAFGPATVFGAGSYPAALAVGDFNRDGAPDVVTADAASKSLTVLINTAPVVSGVPPEPGNLPQARLLAPRPSPGRGDVRLDFVLPAPATIAIDIFDVSGRVIRTVASGPQPAGSGSVVWDGRNGAGGLCAAGIYLARLSAGRETSTAKIIRLGR